MYKSRQGNRQLRQCFCLAACCLIASLNIREQVFGQLATTTVVVEGAPNAEAAAAAAAAQAAVEQKSLSKKPGSNGKNPPGGEANKEGEKTEKKDVKTVEPVKRQSEPPAPPDKRELDIKADDTGLVQFQFRNQAWPDVLRWLAETSSMSLDWQELPGDYLNLATRRPHTIEETRDLFNRHLLARGYTLLEIDNVLQVAKTEGINTALVPKVDPADLAKLPPNRFVRVSISLDSLVAEEVIDEFKMLISANGKLIPLQSTNRLEAMDAAGNLKELYRIVTHEQSEEARARLAREFILKHVRANDVKSQLEAFLGIQKSSSMDSGGSSSRQMQQQMQEMMQQQMQQMQQQRGGEAATGGADKSKQQRAKEVYLVANQRQNSVIVHAQPDKMAIVEAFVKRVDVPNANAEDFEIMQSRMQVFRLASISPKQLMATLLSMDALEPSTKLEVDEENKALIVNGSMSDRYAIQKVIERMDGSARNFEMIQLKRLRAEEVAGTVKFLMGTDTPKKDDSSSRRYYSFYDSFNQSSDTKKQTDSFRVGANVGDNQLLLWCNESERKEVVNLLVKLGELPPEGAKPSPFRTIDASRSRDTLEYLRQLQEKWKSISPNPLVLPNEDQFDPPAPPADLKETESKEKATPAAEVQTSAMPLEKPSTSNDFAKPFEKYVLAEDTAEAKSDSSVSEANKPKSEKKTPGERVAVRPEPSRQASMPPIEIRFDSQGNLLLWSEDLEALDRLETLMLRNAPPKRPYDVFKIEHTRASYIALNLEEYFKDSDKSKNDSSRNTYYYFDASPQEKKKDDPQLGSKRELKFIWDNETSTIVAVGASDAQRKLIGELIKLWDTPDPKKDKNARYQRLVQVQYSKAEAIEQAIKDALRDFLTENDKTFDRNAEDGKKGGEKRDRSDSDRKFSMGVDAVTNIIIVTAEGEELLNVICEMIEKLDVAAKPSGSLEVVQFETGGTTKSMEKALKALMESAKKPAPQEKQRGQQNGQQGEGNGNQNGGDR